MAAHKPLHLVEAPSQRIRGFLGTKCEQSGPSKQHRFSPEGVQPAIRPIPGTNNTSCHREVGRKAMAHDVAPFAIAGCGPVP